eukprot:scaffold3436_cov32-Tisochrysis_lutea.AAC.5
MRLQALRRSDSPRPSHICALPAKLPLQPVASRLVAPRLVAPHLAVPAAAPTEDHRARARAGRGGAGLPRLFFIPLDTPDPYSLEILIGSFQWGVTPLKV